MGRLKKLVLFFVVYSWIPVFFMFTTDLLTLNSLDKIIVFYFFWPISLTAYVLVSANIMPEPVIGYPAYLLLFSWLIVLLLAAYWIIRKPRS
ncbi:MAG: hypothetical protein A2655_00280 [Candidatus Yanofskybacteria bacterium RIFCSPHIGHO2_01_FULL_43_42]|uniref:Uncharacterized protein n=1 Tax=Candidatus Yanofskybacteria bacterium RIFCSPLOWO2_01_FULL_43_22 TaxID=1802695 RepID=A0A1F8GH08_9BACT|nr:MAG: hypothetical protein A2655_00280 [Candidatus Yanofskybacteria bacterium RIFCSPHIGHO2_01_FULL_43_42]OGN12582.1 MAG: hypothetical protein A3D48_04610 [Candidatus Yanofskybacteria bacterium RIFCSPHIGHO2_02_FULL_43_17]OGN23729.1 MAG: hypothetical protein A3A13_00270 [Candidatus Yanofskybacteria bacterium RIFCSPLOWO2_01_FULL_43_22]